MEIKGFTADLQFHFFNGSNYGLLDILEEMEKKRLNGLALLQYDWEKRTSFEGIRRIGPKIRERFTIEIDSNTYKFTSKESGETFYLIFGQEVTTLSRNWHILAIGAIGIKSWSTSEDIIEDILKKGGLAVIDHPFADPKRMFRDISSEKEEELIVLCEKYKGRIVLEWNGYCLPQIRRFLPGYSDVNKKVELLAKELKIPLVPTTDLHAGNKRLLRALGTSFIEIPLKNIDFSNFLFSLRENITESNFMAHKNYVSFWHFVKAFGWPLLKETIAGKR